MTSEQTEKALERLKRAIKPESREQRETRLALESLRRRTTSGMNTFDTLLGEDGAA
jgi:hypothetical protein